MNKALHLLGRFVETIDVEPDELGVEYVSGTLVARGRGQDNEVLTEWYLVYIVDISSAGASPS